jgi:hypothetical protein
MEFRAPMGKGSGFGGAGVLEKFDDRRIPMTHATVRSTHEAALMIHALSCGEHIAGVGFWKRVFGLNLDVSPVLSASTATSS